MRKFIFLIVLYLSGSALASGQNLDKLLSRAQRYLQARASMDKVEMQRYVRPDMRKEFLNRNPPPMSDTHMEGLELTTDPKVVYVVYTATITIQDVGPVPAKVRQPWIWDGKDWFLKLDEGGNPLEVTKNESPQPAQVSGPPFELTSKKIDFGRHIQGDIVTKTFEFKSNQDRFGTFRHSASPGLLLRGPTWHSKEIGEIEAVLDTTMLNGQITYPVQLQIFDPEGRSIQSDLEISATIEPRLLFSQKPEIIDPGMAGTAEIDIKNVSNITYRPTSLVFTNREYEVLDYAPRSVAPGETLKIMFAYKAQPDPTGVALNMETFPAVLAKPAFIVSLNVKLPVVTGPGFTKEQLDEIIKHVK